MGFQEVDLDHVFRFGQGLLEVAQFPAGALQ